MVRTFSVSPVCNPMPLVNEIPLKLARKCMDVFGVATFDAETDIHTISTYHYSDFKGFSLSHHLGIAFLVLLDSGIERRTPNGEFVLRKNEAISIGFACCGTKLIRNVW